MSKKRLEELKKNYLSRTGRTYFKVVSKVFLCNSDKKLLENRKCFCCKKKLKRPKGEWINDWINRRFCSFSCKVKYQAKFGCPQVKNEYRLRKVMWDKRINKMQFGITVPSHLVRKHNLEGKKYSYLSEGDKLIIYLEGKKGKYVLRKSGLIFGKRKYYILSVPNKFARKHNLEGKIYSCSVIKNRLIVFELIK